MTAGRAAAWPIPLGCFGGQRRAAPHDVRAALVILTEHVKEEQVDVVVQRLVVQEELGQVAQVLAVQLLLLAVHLAPAQAGPLSTDEKVGGHRRIGLLGAPALQQALLAASVHEIIL